MIPLQVTLEGFLSYEKKQAINFVGASIWALSGPNSVGKSAVFDAMTFALYHRARCGPKDLIHHRADRLIVTFDFMVDDTIYRIKRIHPSKGRSTREAFIVDCADGSNLDSAPTKRIANTDSEDELHEWVKQTIGMDYAAFTSSCLLLQGKSEQLLDVDPRIRRDILAELMDLSRYEKLHVAAEEQRKAFRSAVETLEKQLLAPNVRVVRDEELEEARTLLHDAEEAWEDAQESIERFSVYLEQARHWEADRAEMQKQHKELQSVQGLVDRETEIASGFSELQELDTVLPLLKQIVEERIALLALRARLDELQCQAHRIEEDVRIAEIKKKAERQAVTDLEASVNDIEQKSKQLLGRLTVLIPLVSKLEAMEQLQIKKEAVDKHIAALPGDIPQQMTQAEQRLHELEDMERTLPWLSNVAQEREQLKATSERERAASEQLPALRARYDELQKSRIALESACIIEQDNERRLDDEKRDSNRRLRDVQNHLQKFAGVATKPECDLCGQEITGEYAKQEQIRLQQFVEECRREVTAVTQQHQDAVDLKNAKERELKELDDQIGEVRGSYGQAEHEQQTAYEQANDHEKRLRAAFEAMSERYRERISGALPEDRAAWLATSYPLPSDIETMQQEVKSKAHQAREVKRIRSLHETWQGLDQQRAVFAQQISEQEQDIDLNAARNARIEKNGIEERQNKLIAESEEQQCKLEQAKKAAQETEDALTSLHEQAQHCENELRAETARREEKERVQRERESSLPIPWRSRANTLEKSGLTALEQRHTDLACYRSLFEQLTSARERIERYQKRIDELDVQISAYPAEARRPVQEVEGELLGRKEAHRWASAERDKAKNRLGDLEGTRERRQELEQQKLEDERMQHLYTILAKHLGKTGLQLFLLNRAERAIVEFANQTLSGLSHGRMRLEWRPESDAQVQTDKALDVVVRDREIGNCAVAIGSVSGSQKFRIAISLAMAIGRYMSRDGRHPESVIIDEGFGGLDKTGRDDMIQELRALGEHVARIILVSHQEEFAYAFPNRYRFKLVDGSSRVTLMDEE
jgi:DNA repair protein SbcC/Rad50